jgi:hypothetical protein
MDSLPARAPYRSPTGARQLNNLVATCHGLWLRGEVVAAHVTGCHRLLDNGVGRLNSGTGGTGMPVFGAMLGFPARRALGRFIIPRR